MSFQQGLSGLNASSKNLEIIGNNIANANTFGAKVARAEFADAYANALNGSGASAVGIAMSMNIGGHLVDVSPLSTIGALCIASAGTTDTRTFFNQLLAWGLSMAVLGAVLSYLLF